MKKTYSDCDIDIYKERKFIALYQVTSRNKSRGLQEEKGMLLLS